MKAIYQLVFTYGPNVFSSLSFKSCNWSLA